MGGKGKGKKGGRLDCNYLWASMRSEEAQMHGKLLLKLLLHVFGRWGWDWTAIASMDEERRQKRPGLKMTSYALVSCNITTQRSLGS